MACWRRLVATVQNKQVMVRWPHFFAVQSGLRFRRNEDPNVLASSKTLLGQAYFFIIQVEMPTKSKQSRRKSRQKSRQTGASSRDVDLIARNAKNAEKLLRVIDVNQQANAATKLSSIKARAKQGFFQWDRTKWHRVASRDREFIETISEGIKDRIQREIRDIENDCSRRRKSLVSLKVSLPRPRHSSSSRI